MKKIFKKAMTVLGSVALVGATVGFAAAASYPAPFTSNTVVVYGSGAAASDMTAAADVRADLVSNAVTDSITFTGASEVEEEEVILGGQIDGVSGYKIETTMTDSKLSSLLDEKINWDDGNGADDYDIHEEIVFGDMKVITSLSDEDLEGVALTNSIGGLSYRYVFDDALNCTGIGTTDADDLYLTILGKEYEITDMTATTVTVVTSEEFPVMRGETVTFQGETFTVEDLSSTAARINGETITEGNNKKINGLKVEVKDDSIFYNENFPDQATVTLKIGEDISKTYSDGDEYIGQDEDDPLWVWDISTACTAAGYIGVQYNANIDDANDNDAGDSIKYVGQSYVLPENFGEVKLVGTTDVEYEDIVVSFEDDADLYNVTESIAAVLEDKNVLLITGEDTDSITVGGEETNEIAIYYSDNSSAISGAAGAYGALEVYYRDHDGDYTPTNKYRYETLVNLTDSGTLARTNLANVTVGDTDIQIDATVASNVLTLSFENPSGNDINLTIGGTSITNNTGTLERLGATTEDADANDIVVSGTDVSTKEKSIMDNYGIIVARDDSAGVEGNADSDEVQISIPSDQVYGIVNVKVGGEAESGSGSNVMTVTDAEADSMSGKNMVVVGGSAINSIAADLLGGAYREGEFTEQTGVLPGEFLIQSFDRSGRRALLVAGYNAADTVKAVDYLLNNDVTTDVGTKYKGSSATEATIVTN